MKTLNTTLLIIFFLFNTQFVFTQNNNSYKLQEDGLIKVTIYYADGSTIQQQGILNENYKPHKTWKMFNIKGELVVCGAYFNGKKTGEWTFIRNGITNVVTYKDNIIKGHNKLRSLAFKKI